MDNSALEEMNLKIAAKNKETAPADAEVIESGKDSALEGILKNQDTSKKDLEARKDSDAPIETGVNFNEDEEENADEVKELP